MLGVVVEGARVASLSTSTAGEGRSSFGHSLSRSTKSRTTLFSLSPTLTKILHWLVQVLESGIFWAAL